MKSRVLVDRALLLKGCPGNGLFWWMSGGVGEVCGGTFFVVAWCFGFRGIFRNFVKILCYE